MATAVTVCCALSREVHCRHDYCRVPWHTNTDALRFTATRILTRPSTNGPQKGGSWLPQQSSCNLGKSTISIFESRRVSRTILWCRRSLCRQRRPSGRLGRRPRIGTTITSTRSHPRTPRSVVQLHQTWLSWRHSVGHETRFVADERRQPFRLICGARGAEPDSLASVAPRSSPCLS